MCVALPFISFPPPQASKSFQKSRLPAYAVKNFDMKFDAVHFGSRLNAAFSEIVLLK